MEEIGLESCIPGLVWDLDRYIQEKAHLTDKRPEDEINCCKSEKLCT